MILLQTQFETFTGLTQYGALGIMTLGLGFVVWYLLKRQLESEDRLRNKVDELQKEINDYIRIDQNNVTETIENNTKAINDLRDLIIKNQGK